MTRRIPEDTPRTLLLALGIWGAASVVAALEGVFAKLSLAELAGLGGFAFAFAAATLYLDRGVRAYLLRARTRSLVTFAIEMDLGIAIGTMLALGLANGNVDAALKAFPLAAVIVFAIPVAAVGHVLLAERLLRLRASRVPGAVLSR
jgi:hypothetical protein